LNLSLVKYQRYINLAPNERYAEYRELEKRLIALCAELRINT
jgi:hypothetical protein